MAIEIQDKLKHMNRSRKIADASDIAYSNSGMEGVDNIAQAIDEMYSIMNAEPKLIYPNEDYNPKQYFAKGETPILEFVFTTAAAGKCTVTITKNGSPYRTFKHNVGPISVPLEPVSTQGTFVYKVSVADSLGRIPNDLSFTFVYGGVTLTSNFDAVLQETVYSANDEDCVLNIPYSIYYAETGGDLHRQILANIYSIDDTSNPVASTSEFVGTENVNDKILSLQHTFVTAGKYVLKLYAIVYSDDTQLKSETLEYNFTVLSTNSIAADILDYTKTGADINTPVDTATPCTLTYRIVTNIPEYADTNGLRAHLLVYKLDSDGHKISTPVKESIAYNVTSGDSKVWTIGRLTDAGNYILEVHGQPSSGNMEGVTDAFSSVSLIVISSASTGSTYEESGLIAYFDAETMTNDMDQPDKWYARNDSSYYIKLNGLNYSTNGWIMADDDDLPCLSFTGDSYGIMHYIDNDGNDSEFAPMSVVTNSSNGHAIEIVFKSRCIGELLSDVLTCRNDTSASTGGYTLRYDEAKITSLDGTLTSRTMLEDEWTHVTFVLDRNIRKLNVGENSVTNLTLDDLNPTATMRIYINGCLSACQVITDWEFFNMTATESNPMPLLLNARYNNSMLPSDFGSCEIKLIRVYNTALTSSQVLGNYINSMRVPSQQLAAQLKNNSGSANVPIIYFVRNKVAYVDVSKDLSKASTFDQLHAIKKKKSDDPDEATSKNSWINCTMWYKYHDEAGTWFYEPYRDVDVYLQGTSSLTYPVKNYQIKVYDPNSSHVNIEMYVGGLGELSDIMIEPGWYTYESWKELRKQTAGLPEWPALVDYIIPESVESKLSSTTNPSLSDAEVLIEDASDLFRWSTVSAGKLVHGSKLRFTPPSVGPEDGWLDDAADYVYTLKCDYMEQSHKNNTPTAIFYETLIDALQSNEFDTLKTKHIDDKLSIARQQTTTYISIDPESGEEVSHTVSKFRDAINGFPTVVYYNNNSGTTDCNEPDDDGEYIDTVADNFAGTFMFNVDKEGRQLGFEISSEENIPVTFVDDDGNTVTAVDKDGAEITIGQLPCVSLEGSSNTSFAAAGAFYTFDEYNKALAEGDVAKDDDGNPITFENYYKYIEATLEPRFSYADDLEDVLTESYGKDVASDIISQLTFEKMKETIEWVSANSDDATAFRTNFESHFSLTYCIAYFLQMMVFTQVDNAGKNAMFDTWGGKWYPRPYDMDTQMGLNNSGVDEILASAEINSTMSRETITGDYKHNAAIISGLDDEHGNPYDSSNHLRFTQYNTKTSKLWNAFSKHYSSEIQSAYHFLRNKGIYSVDNICNMVEGLTSNVIGEKFYNMDASSKYLNTMSVNADGSIDTKYLYACQGNRTSRYRQFLKHRLTFLDTKFNYTFTPAKDESGNEIIMTSLSTCLNTISEFRSDVPTGSGNDYAYLGIASYTPQYITVSMGTDCTITAYVDENSKYKLDGIEYEGILLKLPFISDNKDWTLSGSANIRALDHMRGLYLTLCKVGQAQKLTNLEITNSNRLGELSVAGNIYLRYLNLSGNIALTQSINLSSCKNIKTINISKSAVTGLTLPVGAPISTLDLTNSQIGSLTLDGLQFLTDSGLKIDGCSKVTSLVMSNVPQITKLDMSPLLALQSLDINRCENITELNLSNSHLSSLRLNLCDNLSKIDLTNCRGSVLNLLALPTVYGLKSLILTGASSDGGIHILLPKFESGNTTERRYNALTEFKASGSNLVEVYYDISSKASSIDDAVVDLSPLTNLNSCAFGSNSMIREVYGFHYTGGLSSMFSRCAELKSVSGVITDCSSLSEAFAYDYELTNLTGLSFINSTATSASMMCYSCQLLDLASIRKLVSGNPNITSASNAFAGCINLTGSAPSISEWTKLKDASYMLRNTNITSVPSNYFNNCASTLTSTYYIFSGCGELDTVGHDLFKNLYSLTDIRGTFSGCGKLSTFIANDFNILPTTCNIVEMSDLFYDCSALKMPDKDELENPLSTLSDLFAPATKLERADSVFWGVNTLTSEYLPDAIFENNKSLISIVGLFNKCLGLTSLPDYLCSKTSNNNPKLLYASGIFANCENITSIIKNTLFTGMEKVQHLGFYRTTTNYSDSGRRHWVLGAFANTKISGFATDFLANLTELTNISCLFAKGYLSDINLQSTNPPTFSPSPHTSDTTDWTVRDNALAYCYIPGVDDPVIGKIVNTVFENNTKLKRVDACFAGNTGFTGICNADKSDADGSKLFESAKSSIYSIDGLFANCSIKIDSGDDNVAYKGLTSNVHINLFKGMTNLVSARNVFAGCFSLTGSIPEDLFEGCNNLASTSGMFHRCFNLGVGESSSSISIPNKLFDSCRNSIQDTSYMFAKCGFAGRIGTGTAPIIGDDGLLANASYDNKGLLAECTSLLNTSAMFFGCRNLKGAIPEDIFYTRDNLNTYDGLTNISYMFCDCYGLGLSYNSPDISGGNNFRVYGETEIDTNTGLAVKYFIPNDWLSRCLNLTNISYLFNTVATVTPDWHTTVINEPGCTRNNSDKFILPDTVFSLQRSITNASAAFAGVSTIKGNLTNEFLKSSLSNLNNASMIFSYCTSLDSVGSSANNAIFQLPQPSDGSLAINLVLKNISRAFYGCGTGLTGFGPNVSQLFRCNNSTAVVSGCSSLSNYSSYADNHKQTNTAWSSMYLDIYNEFANNTFAFSPNYN